MSLKVYCGPMYSCKSKTMMGEINRWSDVNKQKALMINHQFDNRDTKHVISSHSSLYKGLSDRMDSISCQQLSTVDVSSYTIIGIDEINFFNDVEDLVNTIKTWIDQGKHIICAGLDSDHQMEPFGYISHLLHLSDSFTKLNAICDICKEELILQGVIVTPVNSTPAPFTKKISHGDQLLYSNVVDIGGHDKYIAVCRKHH